jgi:septal ring factor EnvC (AmiA/AmiB activator)
LAEHEVSYARFGREIAAEAPKTVELETRISRLEDLVRQLREDLAVMKAREVALQAQLDYLIARAVHF